MTDSQVDRETRDRWVLLDHRVRLVRLVPRDRGGRWEQLDRLVRRVRRDQ